MATPLQEILAKKLGAKLAATAIKEAPKPVSQVQMKLPETKPVAPKFSFGVKPTIVVPPTSMETVGNAHEILSAFDSDDGESFESDEDVVDETVNTPVNVIESSVEFDARRLSIANMSIPYDPSQIAAAKGLLESQAACLVGAAGTGKTTTTKLVVHLLVNGSKEWGIEPLQLRAVNMNHYSKSALEETKDKQEDKSNIIPSVALCAFTGQAVQVIKKNMPGEWHRNVMTIHSLLGYAPVEFLDEESGKMKIRFEPSYTAQNKMPWHVIFFDESSMVAVDLFKQVLAASRPGTRYYFIGDINQLSPVMGDGILGYAMAKLPVFELTVIHRQADPAANKIIEVAHSVLTGQTPEFDDATVNPNWRVIGFELPSDPQQAHQQIVKIAWGLSKEKVSPKVDPNTPVIYDPWRDRILTPGNGENENSSASNIGQVPLNDSLSLTFADPNYPRMIIDAGLSQKKFSVGYRVMATSNEAPNMKDRVTNGLTGTITHIEDHVDWFGDRLLVGDENVVRANRQAMLARAMRNESMAPELMTDEALAKIAEGNDFNAFDLTSIAAMAKPKTERESGPASHKVTVKFDNGATRIYSTKNQVDQLRIAYASTVHKAQGAEMPTVIIVIHHAIKRMLSRELFYTAITRASQRVIILYTPMGMRAALARQEIFGNTVKEKVQKYIRNLGGADGTGLKVMNISFTPRE